MKATKKTACVLAVLFLAIITVSCQSTGEYLPLSNNETVIGTVQVTFEVRSSFFFMKKVKDGINTEAYIKLLEAAGHKYSGNNDIRDIVWVTGKPVDNIYTEIFATGKVIGSP
jgi:hypothetical protein